MFSVESAIRRLYAFDVQEQAPERLVNAIRLFGIEKCGIILDGHEKSALLYA